MTKAEFETIEVDALLAADFLDRVRGFAIDAGVDGLSDEARMLLLHSATVAACDAALAASGSRVRGAEGGHRLRIEETSQRLGAEAPELFDRLDDARLSRNEVSYAIGLAPTADVAEAGAAVDRLLALVEAFVRPHLPPWRTGPDR